MFVFVCTSYGFQESFWDELFPKLLAWHGNREDGLLASANRRFLPGHDNIAEVV